MILDRMLDDLENSYRRRRRREKFEMVNFLSSHLRASLNRAPPTGTQRASDLKLNSHTPQIAQ